MHTRAVALLVRVFEEPNPKKPRGKPKLRRKEPKRSPAPVPVPGPAPAPVPQGSAALQGSAPAPAPAPQPAQINAAGGTTADFSTGGQSSYAVSPADMGDPTWHAGVASHISKLAKVMEVCKPARTLSAGLSLDEDIMTFSQATLMLPHLRLASKQWIVLFYEYVATMWVTRCSAPFCGASSPRASACAANPTRRFGGVPRTSFCTGAF
jgi:hypothetical protein